MRMFNEAGFPIELGDPPHVIHHHAPGPHEGVQTIMLPDPCKIIGFFQNGHGTPAIYYVRPENTTNIKSRRFIVMGTGWNFPTLDDDDLATHIGTCRDYIGGVWHCFEIIKI